MIHRFTIEEGKKEMSRKFKRREFSKNCLNLGIFMMLESFVRFFSVEDERKGKNYSYEKKGLNPRYTFSTFVVGKNNYFTHHACLAIANSPGKVYNPLLICGDSGLGKTHLINAIGNHVLSHNPYLKVFFVTPKVLHKDMVHHLYFKTIEDFRKKYISGDVFLIDDIHILSESKWILEELFHIFDHLYSARKQNFLTSVRAPKCIPFLEEIMHSRFKMGLIANLISPPLETLVGLLKKKCEEENISLPDNIAIFIASEVQSDLRKIERVLKTLKTYASTKNTPIDLSLTKEALKNIIDFKSNRLF